MPLLDRRTFCQTLLAVGIAPPIQRVSLHVDVPVVPVRVENDWLLVYELHVRNEGRDPIELASVSVDTRRIAGAELRDRIGKVDDVTAPAQHIVIYLEVPVSVLPRRVVHEVEYQVAAVPEIHRVRDDGVSVGSAPRIGLGPPLMGGPWVAVHSPTWPRGHRRVFYSAEGRQILPGRFAIDWVRVDEQGRIARGDANRVANHYGYGAPVLAVCDGRIVATRDGMSEPATLDTAAAEHTLDEAAGNYVVLQLSDQRFAIYEHLRPGSLTVREGDRVRAGQTLAEVGFTGSSTGPHLHLHVSEIPQPLKGEGAAYHFERFELLGHYSDIGQLGGARWQEGPRELKASRRREHPASNAVLMFDPRA